MKQNIPLSDKIRLFNGQGNWNTYSADGKIPFFTMSDGPHGLRKQGDENYSDINDSKTATCFPTGSSIACSWDRECLKLMGKSIALEAKNENVNLILGPGINIKRSPLCGRNFEYFSEDPFLAGTLGENYVKGMQSEGTGSCIKHFAMNNQETLRQVSNSLCDRRTMNEIYLKAFEIVVKNANPAAIMESYNLVNGKPACKNEFLLKETLRKNWGFKGAVISDWGACLDAGECLKAGMDLAMPDSHGYFEKQLKKSLDEERITEEDLDSANSRVIELAEKYKLPSDTRTSEEKASFTRQLLEENHKNAVLLGTKSAVLLKNENFLPLKNKILILGAFAENPRCQGGGSSHINCKKYDNVIIALEKLGFEVIFEKAFEQEKKSTKLEKRALKEVQNAKNQNIPVLIFTGLPDTVEGEGFDRQDLNLPEHQKEFIKKVLEINENTGLVNFSGSPVIFENQNKLKAILQMYLCGEASGEVCALILSGKVNPSGRLAETWPLNLENCPSQITQDLNVIYKEGIFTGYRHYETFNIPVQFEFGFGLSYTTFEYSDLKIEGLKISFKIKNTGKLAGEETSQIYIMPENYKETVTQKSFRSKTELKAFEKNFLEPGQEKTVEIQLKKEDFAVFSPEKNQFVVPGGVYTISVNSSVKKQRLAEKIVVEGEISEEISGVFKETIKEEDFASQRIFEHTKGCYTIQDNLKTLAKTSLFARILIFVFSKAIRIMNLKKKKNDPAIRIAVSAICENPLESLISTSGGMISEKFTRKIVKIANGR